MNRSKLAAIVAISGFALAGTAAAHRSTARYHGPPEPSLVYLRIADGIAALEVSTGDQPTKTVVWNDGVTTFHVTNTAGFTYISDDTCSRVSQTELVCSAQGATKASVSIYGSHVDDDIDASRLTLDYIASLGEGNDRFVGGNAPPNPSDYMDHGKGAIIRGGAGDDTIVGGPGPDMIRGELGNDTLSGGAGDDEIWDDDRAVVGMLDDTLNGGPGNDALVMSMGSDKADGGPGNDAYFTSLGLSKRHSVIKDSGGRDSLAFSPACNKAWKITGTTRHTVYRSSHGILDVFGVERQPCRR